MGDGLNTGSTSGSQSLSRGSSFALGTAAILLMALLAVFAIHQLGPTAAGPSSVPAFEFSSGRALAHVAAMAHKPRPPGSAQHFAARDYIVSELTTAGLTPEVQRTTAISSQGNAGLRAATVENIIARLQGTANTKAVLLVSHYDSVPASFGAGDDASGVAVLLETLRALKAGSALNNDVIFLFTDAEEVGLLGAHAFINEHPWAREVGLVLNFEARGTTGPSILFETSDQNGRLIKEFSKAAPHPVTNSLAYEVYRLLPNDTDLTVFKNAGLPGLNFAYIDRSTHYHTQLDSIEELDERSLQHHGAYALALTKHFGNLDLLNVRERNAVYFDVLGLFLVRYSGAFVPLISVSITVPFLALVVFGWRKGRFTSKGLALGFVVQLATLIVVPVGLALGLVLMQRLFGVFGKSAQAIAYQSKLYIIGFALVAIAISYIAHAALASKIRIENFMASSLACWMLLLILTSVLLPGVSYLLTWPVLFCLPGFGYLLLTGEQKPRPVLLILLFLLAVIPALLMLTPAIYLIFIGLNLNSIGIVMLMLVLVCMLLVPHFLSLRLGHDRNFAIILAVVGVVVVGAAVLKSTHDVRRPRLDSLFYGLNADTGKAIWASFDGKPDEWTSRVLSTNPQKQAAREFFAAGWPGSRLQADAEAVPVAAPSATVLADDTRDKVRTMRLRITSPRGAPVLLVFLDSVRSLQGVWVNEKRFDIEVGQRTRSWNLHYYNVLPEGIELTLQLSSEESLNMRLVDLSYGLPDLPDSTLGSRPAGIIPAPVVYNDTTLVSKSVSY